MQFCVGEVMEEFYAILREFTELYKNIGEIKRKEMSSNIDIKRICAWCKQEFIAHKTTTTCCSHRCANLLYKQRKREAAVKANTTVVVLSALYISLQMTLNELLLPRMEKFLMRFPAFQKLEEVAVAAETPALIVEPIEEVAVTETTPQPTEYEVLRANAIAERERASQAKLERVLDYTKQTMVAYMSEAELDRLCGYITEYSLGDTPREVSPVSVDSALKSIDLMHFGWNIGKAFGKKRIHTATFIKRVFAHALRDIEVSTIERKMSHTESECRIKLDGKIG